MKPLWNDHGIRLTTKIAAYQAIVLTTLLYGCESWTPYRRHIAKLDHFHLRYLHKIAHIKWQDQIPNTTVLERCQISGIKTYLLVAQFRWTGHVIRMVELMIPKRLFYSQLAQGSWSCGGQFKRYKDTLKANLKSCCIPFAELESGGVRTQPYESTEGETTLTQTATHSYCRLLMCDICRRPCC